MSSDSEINDPEKFSGESSSDDDGDGGGGDDNLSAEIIGRMLRMKISANSDAPKNNKPKASFIYFNNKRSGMVR
jgi:hypothetical protein